MTVGTRIIRAPRGPAISCKSWQQEAALRMLMNNLDPDVAERPQDLVVYGGTGKAARNWACYDALVDTLQRLKSDPHSPSEFRCNGIVRNIPEWYSAFGVQQNDKLFLPAEQRVKIW